MQSNRKERKPLPYSPNSYNSMREQGSPTKASVLLQQDHADYIDSLVSRKENFCTCLDLYKVSFENELPQKCLIHNNFITLYCENEFKLLCVNCIYGSAIHKDHRVIPSKNSISNIARDNEQNIKVLEEQLDKIRHVETEMKKNQRTLGDEYNLIIKQVDEEFSEIYRMIQAKHTKTKDRVIEAFSKAKDTNLQGMRQVNWWRGLLTTTRTQLPKPSLQEEPEVYKHLVLDLFMQEKIDQQKLTYIASGQQIRNQFLRSVVELRQAVEQTLGLPYQPQKSKIKMF